MTNLKCNVTSCASNCEGGCMRNGITVTGDCATGSCETCCSSFTLSHNGSVNACGCNVPMNAQKAMPINCTAKNCIHNQNGCCEAGEVQVGGRGASAMSQTSCETFSARS